MNPPTFIDKKCGAMRCTFVNHNTGGDFDNDCVENKFLRNEKNARAINLITKSVVPLDKTKLFVVGGETFRKWGKN